MDTQTNRSLHCRSVEPHDERDQGADRLCVSAIVLLLMLIALMGAGT